MDAGVYSEIPHGQDSKLYEAILSGRLVDYLVGTRRRKRPAALEADADIQLCLPSTKSRRTEQGAWGVRNPERMLDGHRSLLVNFGLLAVVYLARASPPHWSQLFLHEAPPKWTPQFSKLED